MIVRILLSFVLVLACGSPSAPTSPPNAVTPAAAAHYDPAEVRELNDGTKVRMDPRFCLVETLNGERRYERDDHESAEGRESWAWRNACLKKRPSLLPRTSRP